MNQKHSKTAVALFTQEDRQLAVAALSAGQVALSVTINARTERMTAANIAGYALLKNYLEDLSPREVAFCANMYYHRFRDLTPKQARWLSDLLKKHMNTKLDLLTEDDTL